MKQAKRPLTSKASTDDDERSKYHKMAPADTPVPVTVFCCEQSGWAALPSHILNAEASSLRR